MKFTLIRDTTHPNPERTLGVLYADGVLVGQTLEDEDRLLEHGFPKVYGKTCIPRGTYEIGLSFSHRFGRIMPEIFHVHDFTGVRIHGGNTTADTFGCPLLCRLRTESGIRDCSGPNARLMAILQAEEDANIKSTIEIT